MVETHLNTADVSFNMPHAVSLWIVVAWLTRAAAAKVSALAALTRLSFPLPTWLALTAGRARSGWQLRGGVHGGELPRAGGATMLGHRLPATVGGLRSCVSVFTPLRLSTLLLRETVGGVHARLTLSQEYLGAPISGLNDTAALPSLLALGDLKVAWTARVFTWVAAFSGIVFES